MPEGRGATVHFGPQTSQPEVPSNSDPLSMRRVGTHGLITCVGVYFSLGPNRCFLAHINALVMRQHQWRFWRDEFQRDIKHEGEASYFKLKLLTKLRMHAKFNDWSPEDHKEEISESLIIACPAMEGRTGKPVVQAVKAFLDIEDEVEVHKKSGFIIEHGSGKPLMLSYDAEQSRPPPELTPRAPLDEPHSDDFEIELNLNPGYHNQSPLI